MDAEKLLFQMAGGFFRGLRSVCALVGAGVHQLIHPLPMSQYIPKEILGAAVLIPAGYLALVMLRMS